SYQILMNPFGFSDLTQRYTQDIAELLITGPYFYPTTGHDHVSVALIEDDTLNTLQMPWPWKYGDHARALDALLDLHPKAVVVDILFVDPREDDTLPQLVEEIARYKRAGVPLYFTDATDTKPGEYPLRKEFFDTSVRQIDPSIDVNAGIARQYPVTGKCFGRDVGHGPCKSLALRVFEDNYPNVQVPPLEGLIELVWGTRTDPTNNKWMRVQNDDGTVGNCEPRVTGFARIFDAFFDTSAVRVRCPYTSVIPAESLFSGAPDPDVEKITKDHIVFYGAALQGVEDRSFTPVNGLLPNVFIHAMALDNLISFKGHPQQNVVTIGGVTLSNNGAQLAAILPVILILSWIHMQRLKVVRRRKARTGESEVSATIEYFMDKFTDFVWHMLALALALAAGLMLMLNLGLSVANWVEVVFVAVELAAMLLISVPDAIWGYLHHVAGGEPDQPREQGT
ncbi:MAG TPA: CHASE2 domain-containing protein, partial [Rhizomicrobium sp.]|nr:CHASE2 domain-containing protein [Rhizomicrobium sp.]